MRDAMVWQAEARNAAQARDWVIDRLRDSGFDAMAATRLGERIHTAWDVAGSAFFGRQRKSHEFMVAIRAGAEDGAIGRSAVAIDLIGDATVSRRLAEQVAAELEMTAGRASDDIDGLLCLTLMAEAEASGAEIRQSA